MSASLAVDNLVAGYGATVVLQDVSFDVAAGGTLAILGRNGVGKSTLLSTLMGFTTRHGGSIRFNGTPIESVASHRRNRLGLGYVPQEREIFPSLTVEENLSVAQRAEGGWSPAEVFRFFPALKERRRSAGNRLSGGEQQMLAIGRALVGAPKVLLLDEPMEGLAPIIVESLYDALARIRDEAALTIVLVEQKADLALSFARDTIVLDRGRIVYRGASAELAQDEPAKARLLGVGAAQAT
ncbi:MAG: ABC transporter ATP-binding protein [Xanthobacteraceae bacterium]|nr:ABC transporter ATP-binding protein [Xanthobacteraceae bacterium]